MRDRELVELYTHIDISMTIIIARPWLNIKWIKNSPTSFGTSCMSQVEPGAWRTAAGNRYRRTRDGGVSRVQ
jgi:hypothetical protein